MITGQDLGLLLLVGIFIFHEESNLMKIIGIIMVIAAILIIGKSDAEKGEEN